MDHHAHQMHGNHNPTANNVREQGLTEGPTDHGMRMYFHVGFDKNILVWGWDADSTGKMIGTIIAIIAIGVLYEWIKFIRMKITQAVISRRTPSTSDPISSEDESSWLTGFLPHLLQTILYGLQVAISFTLMLFAMTFNVWIFLAVISGMALGYLLFASRPTRGRRGTFSVNDCCNYTTPTIDVGGEGESQQMRA